MKLKVEHTYECDIIITYGESYIAGINSVDAREMARLLLIEADKYDECEESINKANDWEEDYLENLYSNSML